MNKKIIISIIATIVVIAGGVYLAFNADDENGVTSPEDTSVVTTNDTIFINNHGGNMEGHTPRGFRGSGTGLFAGDNLNPGFPDGDGVQLFLTFDLQSLADSEFHSAILSSQSAHVQGTPFGDLGALAVEAVEYSQFSPALWELEPIDSVCILAVTGTGPFACDVTSAIKQALEDGRKMAQFRIRFEAAGDNDGDTDLILFYNTNSNINEPGLFKLTVNPGETSADAQEYFNEKLRAGVIERIGQPIHGFVPSMFTQAFSGIVPEDFDGADALLGEYKIAEKELIFIMDKGGPIHSAAEMLSDEGMKTVFENIQKRFNGPVVTTDEVDRLLLLLGAPSDVLVTKCLPEQRNLDACIEIYQPVCAKVNVQCVTTPCDPVEETFPNSCFACTNSFVESYTEGECSSK